MALRSMSEDGEQMVELLAKLIKLTKKGITMGELTEGSCPAKKSDGVYMWL